jgi:hypothetical protein
MGLRGCGVKIAIAEQNHILPVLFFGAGTARAQRDNRYKFQCQGRSKKAHIAYVQVPFWSTQDTHASPLVFEPIASLTKVTLRWPDFMSTSPK